MKNRKTYLYYTDLVEFTKFYIRQNKIALPLEGFLKRNHDTLLIEMELENKRRKIKLSENSKKGVTQETIDRGIRNLEICRSNEEIQEKRITNLRIGVANSDFHKNEVWKNAKNTWRDPKRLESVRAANSKMVTCPHCEKTGGQVSMKGWHFDYCPENPNRKLRKSKSKNKIKTKNATCPHCEKTGALAAMKSWHFDYCPENPNRKLRNNKQKEN